LEIHSQEIVNVCKNYLNVCKKGGYYNRKDNFAKIYDHFFIKLLKKVEMYGNIEDFEKTLNKNIQYCSNDNYITLELTKINLELSKRKIIIPNFYDVLYFEILTHKIIKIIMEIFHDDPDLTKLLLKNKYL